LAVAFTLTAHEFSRDRSRMGNRLHLHQIPSLTLRNCPHLFASWKLRDAGFIDRMPQLVCYPATTLQDADMHYDVVHSERITEGYVRRKAAKPILPPNLPPVVEIHEQILLEEVRSAPWVQVAGSNGASSREVGSNGRRHGHAQETIVLNGDEDNDDDSVFVDYSMYATPQARKRKGRGGAGGPAKSNQRSVKPKAGTAGDGLDNRENEPLLPPDSDHVRHLLSLGYKRWGKPTLLASGKYKRSTGRIFKGYAFDEDEGLLKPISTTTTKYKKRKNSALVTPSANQAATLTSASAESHVTCGQASAEMDEGVDVPEPLAHSVAGQVAPSFASPATTSASVPAKDTATNGIVGERIEVSEPVAQAVSRQVSSSVVESAKAQILAQLPSSYKDRFLQTGFDTEDMSRVTIVSPFDSAFDLGTRARWLNHLKEENKKGLGSESKLLFCVRRVVVDEMGHQQATCALLRPDRFVRVLAGRCPDNSSSRADVAKEPSRTDNSVCVGH
jgi:hypothetical protein